MGQYSNLVLAKSGLVGYWRMNDSSSPLVDLVAGRNAAVTGDALYRQAALIAADAEAKSFAPNAGDMVAVVQNHASLHPGDTFSFACWTKLSGVGAVFILLSLGTGDVEININTTGNIRLQKQGTGNSCITKSAYTDTRSPHHLVITKSGGTNIIYRDGAAVQVTVTNQTMVKAASDVYLASKAGALPWNGLIADIALYNTVLSPDEVAQLYRAGLGSWPRRALMGVGY